MQWLVTNWFWLLIGIAFVWMHLFGHGGHGGHGCHGGHGEHGGHGGQNRARLTEDGDPEDPDARGVSRDLGGHQH